MQKEILNKKKIWATRFVLLLFFAGFSVTGMAKIRIYKNVPVDKFPEALKENLQYHEWEKGFLDVTKPPYNAKADGVSDDTEAIQSAIDDAFVCNLIVFFPTGTYLVSGQLTCNQLAGPDLPNNPIGEKGQRKFGHILLGSEKGAQWPTIKLRDNSMVEDNLLILFQYIGTDGQPDASRHYLGTIRNFNIDMGNNPDVSALSNDGAQHCAIENIHISGNFNVGITALPGSGGYTANVSIVGGKTGILQTGYRPNPTVFGLYLEGQSVNAIKITESRGAVTFSGFEIVGPSSSESSYKAIEIYNDKYGTIEQGARANLNLVDGSIEVFNENPAITSYKQDIVIKDVYFKCSQITRCGTYSSNLKTLEGDNTKWQLLNEYVYSTSAGGSVYINQQNKKISGQDYENHSDLVDGNPPDNLLTKHIWGEMPSWEDDILDITNYGATRDDNSDDDAIAIQRAIDSVANPESSVYNKVLFIPRGHFHIKSPITIKKGVKVIGGGKNISLIMVDESWQPTSLVTAVTTENVPESGIVLSDFGLVCYDPIPELIQHKNITLLELKAGGITMRDVQTDRRLKKYQDCVYEAPMVVLDGNISGELYGISLDYGTRGTATTTYRLLSVKNSPGTVNFYQLSIEDASDVVLNENLVHFEVNNCKHVAVWGFKYENQSELLHVSNTKQIEIFGGSGNYSISDPANTSILRFENTEALFLANLSRTPQSSDVEGKYFIYDDGTLVTDDAPVTFYNNHDTLISALTITTGHEFEVSLLNNPVEEIIRMKVHNSGETDTFRYTLSSVNGTLIKTGYLLNEGINTIQCGNLPHGIFILHVYLNDYYKSWKVLKV